MDELGGVGGKERSLPHRLDGGAARLWKIGAGGVNKLGEWGILH